MSIIVCCQFAVQLDHYQLPSSVIITGQPGGIVLIEFPWKLKISKLIKKKIAENKNTATAPVFGPFKFRCTYAAYRMMGNADGRKLSYRPVGPTHRTG